MLLTAPVGFICQSALNVKVIRGGQISRVHQKVDLRSDLSLRRHDLGREL
jgi:hypothetical protein